MSTAAGQLKIHQIVTEKITDALKQGVVPWRQTWSGNGLAGLPCSMSSGKHYEGSNIWMLGLTAMDRGYRSPWWGTFDKIAELSGCVKDGRRWVSPDGTPRGVRKGQNKDNGTGGTTVVAYNVYEKVNPDTGEIEIFPTMHFNTVFNAEQADGLPDKYYPSLEDRGGAAVIEASQAICDGYLKRKGAPRFQYQGDRAYYKPGPDLIVIPPPETFESAEARYAVEFHEFSHSTGHSSRLDRPGIDKFDHFGSEKYSKEELVAEMGSAMLCMVAGIDTAAIFQNSVAYIANWLTVLDNDPKMVIRASSAASKAMKHVLGTDREKE